MLATRFRTEAARVIRELETDELCEVIAVSQPLFEAALTLYESRRDQEWGARGLRFVRRDAECRSAIGTHLRPPFHTGRISDL